MVKQEIQEARNNQVVKSNDLVRNFMGDYEESEIKTLLFCMSKIEPKADREKKYRFNISDYIDIIGIDQHKNNIEHTAKSLKSVRDKSWWLREGSISRSYTWFDELEIDHETNEVVFNWHKTVYPKIQNIASGEGYIKYNIVEALCLKGKQTIPLFELLRSYLHRNQKEYEVIFTMENLRSSLNIGNKYPSFKDFRVNILDKAIEQINDSTYLKVTYEPHGRKGVGGKILKIRFFLRNANEKEVLELWKSHSQLRLVPMPRLSNCKEDIVIEDVLEGQRGIEEYAN